MHPFPLWLVWALAGHLANGAAFVIDNTLLRKSFKRPATYAGIIGLLGVLTVILLPFGVRMPTLAGLPWIVISGATFILSLWAFFAALAKGEASRVIPIIGSLIPILTLAGTFMFLGERLTQPQFVGFGLLILATVILSGGSVKSRLTMPTIRMSVLAAVLFAVSSVTVKIAYISDGFLTTFAVSRFFGVAAALVILSIDREAIKEVRHALFPRSSKNTSHRAHGYGAVMLVITAQTLGALGYVGVQYATSLGSAALVNALQAVQYVLLVVVAFALHTRAPDLLGEDLTVSTVIRKSVAIAIAGAGMWLIV
ncbi:MAG TPA: EamA family transporter [Candidatus Methylomirabilis sp.]|nr:EamA family transporter [Candidatus Methylomirabilis sp.]